MTTKKPAGRAKSAVDGKYITKESAKDNPRETFIESVDPRTDVRLKLDDLRIVRRAVMAYCATSGSVLPVVVDRIEDEIDRAIAALKREMF